MAFTVKNRKPEKTITPYLVARWLTNRAGAFLNVNKKIGELRPLIRIFLKDIVRVS
jgi:hypothetical protein